MKRAVYHNTNETLIKAELQRREDLGEPVRWFRAEWRMVYDVIKMIEDDIVKMRNSIEEWKTKRIDEISSQEMIEIYESDILESQEKIRDLMAS